jgi:cytochrome oxidase Cu insertion factor (SCO1/SenC/PrrC family)
MRRFLLAAAFCLVLGGLGGLLAAAVEPSPAPARYRFVPPREAAFDFNLRDQDGKPTSIASARGKVLAVTWLYATCRDLCPAEANLIGAAMKRAGPGVLAYSISVDPVGDTPERARGFMERRGLDPSTFKWLFGSREELAPIWRAYGIAPVNATPEEAIAAAEASDAFRRAAASQPPRPRRPYSPPERDAPPAAEDAYPDPSDFSYRGRSRHIAGLDFEHSAYVMLIDKHGRQRVGIPFEQLDVAGLAADIEALLRER